MHIHQVITALSLPASLHAMVIAREQEVNHTMGLEKRDPCDGVNASPVLYHEYREADCPARFKFSSDGSCEGAKNPDNDCQAFCQVLTFTITGGASGRLLDAFSLGVSGGFSYVTAKAFSRAFTVKLDIGQCGYFTFVPVRRDICGTLSLYGTRVGWTGIPYCDTAVDRDPIQNIQNFCSGSAWNNPDGTADGETIFVRTDCANRAPLDMDQQDPVYQNPGVALDRGKLAAMIDAWQTNTCDVSYEFLFDKFEVRGKAWADNELGANGEGLEAKIRGCGALTGWKFQWTPDDPNFEWYASGKLPIGVKNCVGSAVTAAGGPSASRGDCNGAG
ncbi:hypothetical protein CONLIGDRAFT_670791 [Coniochaeta ligniaria NRRL 30616]|uniref:Uncharacterized protein n=1 Tax=Coniochaeta ligniaria NRRL 30616 TaxID=1408157 RepID=A0A1J7JII4_9PEZI|nr:hypothetical protein CONLIGDRAFT_670791 [Coniochaeta ligniaria NRRL 30616]